MYHFFATGPGRVDLLRGSVDLMGGDVLSVESNEANYVLNSYKSFLVLSAYDPEELEVKDSPAALINQATAQAAEQAPSPTVLVGLDEHANAADSDEADPNVQIDTDLPAGAKAPEAAAYISLLMEADPVPLVKIKAIASRYAKNKQIQTLVSQAENKVNLPG